MLTNLIYIAVLTIIIGVPVLFFSIRAIFRDKLDNIPTWIQKIILYLLIVLVTLVVISIIFLLLIWNKVRIII